MARIVVVGGSLGGLRATEFLISLGWQDEVVVISEEKHPPYTRPPLSKAALAAAPDLSVLSFQQRHEASHATWRFGVRAESSDLEQRTVHLSDGTTLEYDGLVAATGVAARRLPPAVAAGGHVVRTYDDCVALQPRLVPGATIVVVGAGFIGCELAATAVELGCEVHVVALDEVPMQVPLGTTVGRAIQRRHEAQGVRFQLGTQVDSITEDADGYVVTIADGTELRCDTYVQAIGSSPCVQWLAGNGLDLRDGVECDNWMRMGGVHGAVAVGDVARFPNPIFDDVPRRVEHWQMPADTARRAAATLLSDLAGEPEDPTPFRPLPSFWSDQFDVRIQSFGNLTIADCTEVLEGDLASDVAVGYFQQDRMVGVVVLGMPKKALLLRRQLMQHLVSPPAHTDGPT